MSQAISLMPALNGFGTYKAASGTEGTESYDAGVDTATETFITEGLAKVLKINNICDSSHLSDCGIPDKVVGINGNTAFEEFPENLYDYNDLFTNTTPNTKAAAFETANGESIIVYYNPNCVGTMNESKYYLSQHKMCANFVYDLNGKKGPNTFGKDIGIMAALYPSDAVVVAPVPLKSEAGTVLKSQYEAGNECKNRKEQSRLPNIDELSTLFFNKIFLGNVYDVYWSSTLVSQTNAWYQKFDGGHRYSEERTRNYGVMCVIR